MAPPRVDHPPEFARRMERMLGEDEWRRIVHARSRRGLRINGLKTSAGELEARLRALGLRVEPVPFAPGSRFVDDPLDRPLGKLWEHQAGHFYAHDPASALPVLALDPQPGERVLDLCAAPGGKTAHLAELVGDGGLVVANEVREDRYFVMANNLDRLGAANVVLTKRDGSRARWPLPFDRVLVDAPCSALGGVHEDPRAAHQYTDELVDRLVREQRRLLAAAYDATRENGHIVYATCTLDPRENEAIASWFLDHFDVELLPLPRGLGRAGMTEVDGERLREEVVGTRRVHPGDENTDGFYVASFRKRAGAPRLSARPNTPAWKRCQPDLGRALDTYGLTDPRLAGATAVRRGKRILVTTAPADDALAFAADRIGVLLGTDRSDGIRLSFDAATTFGRGARQAVDLDEEQALRWMAGEDLPAAGPTPYSIVRCGDEPLGCTRSFGPLLLTHVPRERRLPADDGRPLVGFLAMRHGPTEP